MSFSGMNKLNSLVRPNHDGHGGWIFGVSITVALSFVLKWWLDHVFHKKGPSQNKGLGRSVPESELDSLHHDHAVFQEFDQVSAQMRETNNLKLSTADKLMLYGLYKQASKGNAPLICLSLAISDQSKHHAWAQFRDMPKPVAAQQYVDHAKDFLNHGGSNKTAKTVELGAGVSSRPAITEEEEQLVDRASMTPEQLFMAAAGEGDVGTLAALLDSKAVHVDQSDEGGQTALHLAADAGNLATVEFLLQRGANARAADQYGISVLQAAVIAGDVGVCQMLLEYGADPDQADHDGDTPRHCAMDDGGKEMRFLFRITGGTCIESVIEEEEEPEKDSDKADGEDRVIAASSPVPSSEGSWKAEETGSPTSASRC